MQATMRTPNQREPWAPWTDPRSGITYDTDGNPDSEMPPVWQPYPGPLLRRSDRTENEDGPDAGPGRRPFFSSRRRAKADPDRAEAIGCAVRLARLERGMTQLELGRLVGVSDRSISELEWGDTMPYPRSLAAIAAALGCEPRDLEAAA